MGKHRFLIAGAAVAGLIAGCDDGRLQPTTSPIGAPRFSEVGANPNPMNANPPPVELSHGSAVISNGTVTLGVLDLGDLNFNGYGVRYNPTNGEAIDVGCLCEGWGAADATSGVQGWASVAMGTVNVGLVSFSSTASTATSSYSGPTCTWFITKRQSSPACSLASIAAPMAPAFIRAFDNRPLGIALSLGDSRAHRTAQ